MKEVFPEYDPRDMYMNGTYVSHAYLSGTITLSNPAWKMDWYCEYCNSVVRAERESCPHGGAPPTR